MKILLAVNTKNRTPGKKIIGKQDSPEKGSDSTVFSIRMLDISFVVF